MKVEGDLLGGSPETQTTVSATLGSTGSRGKDCFPVQLRAEPGSGWGPLHWHMTRTQPGAWTPEGLAPSPELQSRATSGSSSGCWPTGDRHLPSSPWSRVDCLPSALCGFEAQKLFSAFLLYWPWRRCALCPLACPEKGQRMKRRKKTTVVGTLKRGPWHAPSTDNDHL